MSQTQLQVIPVSTESGFSIFLTPVPCFGAPVELRPALRAFYDRLSSAAAALLDTPPRLYLQFNPLALDNCHELLTRHAAAWMPQIAMGVFPELPEPRMFTQEEFEEMDPRQPVRPLNHQLFHLSTDGKTPETQALNIMAGTGSIYQLWGNAEGLKTLSTALYDSMVEDVFRVYPSYEPMFSGASFKDLANPKLQQSLAPVSGFLRESVEDQGVLWGLRAPAEHVLQLVGARPAADKTAGWFVG